MKKYKNKYRITSARLPDWDYGSKAGYYITICTQNREHYFGKIRNRIMNLSIIGRIVENEWIRTPEIRSDMNLILNEFVVMPNHFHGIIFIGANEFNSKPRGDAMQHDGDAMHGKTYGDAMHRVSTDNEKKTNNRFAAQSKNLASIIRGFKSSVTTYAREHDIDFAWQARYYDHIIRNDIDLNRIRTYIIDNPGNWEEDEFR